MASAEGTQNAAVATEEYVNKVADKTAGAAVKRYFTIPGRDPFEELEWELRDAFIAGKDKPTFEQKDVEFPKFWSQTATNIVAQKYFRGRMSSPEREFILVNQLAAFNSPVWFNVGFEEKPQCSACQPYHALVSTPEGMVPIGELADGEQIGREVYDADGTTRIVAVKHNGRKPVYRVQLRNGSFVEATPDHVVKAVAERRTQPQWLRVDELKPGMRLHLHPHRAKVRESALVLAGGGSNDDETSDFSLDGQTRVAVAEAALAGWLQADGFVGQYDEGTNRSLTIEFQVANDEEYAWVIENLDLALPHIHRHVRDVETQDASLACRRIRLYGEDLREF